MSYTSPRNSCLAVKSQREALILEHMPQVELLARRLHRRCPQQVELDDLISAGTIGLIQAVDRHDPSMNFKVKTLAEHRIRGALLDYLRQLDPLPRRLRQFQKRRDAVIAELVRPGQTPTHDEVARVLGLPVAKYIRLSLAITASETVSLEKSVVAKRLTG